MSERETVRKTEVELERQRKREFTEIPTSQTRNMEKRWRM